MDHVGRKRHLTQPQQNRIGQDTTYDILLVKETEYKQDESERSCDEL